VDFLCDRIVLDSDHSGHEIVVSAEILCGRVIDNVSSQFEGFLEIRRHHGVVDDDKGIRASSCTISEIRGMSAIFIKGLVGVSSRTRRIFSER
jgi:hypothetical protein